METGSTRTAQESRTWRTTHPGQLVELLVHPRHALPRLQARPSTFDIAAFPAISGIFVAYTVAKGLVLGDSFGFVFTALLVIAGGSLLGLIALWFAGSLTHWSAPLADEDETEAANMFVLFAEATWPFLPLLLIVVPLDLYYHGTDVFSASRTATPATVVWLTRALIFTAIGLWLVMLVRGTAVTRHETEGSAARELMRWATELLAIAVLLGVILALSLMYW